MVRPGPVPDLHDQSPLVRGGPAELFRDQDGSRVAGIGNVNYGWPAAPGFAGTFTEVTLGLNWHPHPNFIVRPEARWDCYSGYDEPPGAAPLRRRHAEQPIPLRDRPDLQFLAERFAAHKAQARTPSLALRGSID